ncbi:CBO2463/CBO2479 domain-containing protein [Melissococcus plutonius]|uniref:Uncharacterized protein n=2 Tax=Melissococcus plutonius TaxID=33970 RepID=A0A2Z5Y499_9ENTE|nr:hypothetical protein [Melissococcus plutonius]MCV2519334.1 hypothetical protein [Melissococcus plutonius]BAL62708.1 hypothetical protein MPD5_1505 [Melissococcus plutonius DAT561]BBC61591.1 hypothetical protein DAT561_1494 [Melissococcus plutonius]
MEMAEKYPINPTLMMGTVKQVIDDQVTLNLRGRLGLITVPEKLILSDEPIKVGQKLQFYFSYIYVVNDPLDYDFTEIIQQTECFSCLIGGHIIHVDDTAVRVQVTDNLGSIYVPRRWIFTNVSLKEGLHVEFYFSKMIEIAEETNKY